MMQSVVIIDDSEPIHKLVRSAMAEEPWRIHSAYNGVQGLEMAASHDADLVLLDVDLPDMNGFDVCRHLKAEPICSRASVIFLTASCTSDEKICGMELLAADYVTKPFDPGELRARVRSAIRTKSILDVIPLGLLDFHSRPAGRGNLIDWG
jgi:two-component system, cell cycle response regulator